MDRWNSWHKGLTGTSEHNTNKLAAVVKKKMEKWEVGLCSLMPQCTGIAWIASSNPEPTDDMLVRRVCQVFLRDCERAREGCGVWGGLSSIQSGVRDISPVWLITDDLSSGACVKGVDIFFMN